MQGTLFQSTRYKSFVNDRDKALEQVHQNAQKDISSLLSKSLNEISSYVSKLIIRHTPSVYNVHSLAKAFENYIHQSFLDMFPLIMDRIKTMRKATFILTYTSEMEAISRATSKPFHPSSHRFEFKLEHALNAENMRGEKTDKRVWYSLMKLQTKITNAFNLSMVQELPVAEIVDKVEASFPKIQFYKRPPRELKPIKESDKNPYEKDEMLSFDFIDDADWAFALDAYKSTELPASRFDNVATRGEEGYYQYNWEVEQDLTDDFVQQVRDGQVDAAEELGIEEFVWVAIIDDKTDDCCLERNGKTTSEIEAMLENGTLDADVCDAVTSPAHPNCRCQMAPVSSTDQVEGPDWKSFNEWLES